MANCKLCGGVCLSQFKICTKCSIEAEDGIFNDHMHGREYKTALLPRPYGMAIAINVAEVESMEESKNGGFTNGNSSEGEVVEKLIILYGEKGEFSVGSTQVATPNDYVVKLGSDKRKRIDRQGEQKGYDTKHARYAVQLGSGVQAGIYMQADRTFSPEHLMAAFRLSYKKGVYVRVFYKAGK
jgi:hypothetical protein